MLHTLAPAPQVNGEIFCLPPDTLTHQTPSECAAGHRSLCGPPSLSEAAALSTQHEHTHTSPPEEGTLSGAGGGGTCAPAPRHSRWGRPLGTSRNLLCAPLQPLVRQRMSSSGSAAAFSGSCPCGRHCSLVPPPTRTLLPCTDSVRAVPSPSSAGTGLGGSPSWASGTSDTVCPLSAGEQRRTLSGGDQRHGTEEVSRRLLHKVILLIWGAEGVWLWSSPPEHEPRVLRNS